MNTDKFINILFPVYNEQLRLENGIVHTLEFMEANYSGQYQLSILDNASSDETQNIALMLSNKFSQVKYIRIEKKGVGVAVREGVKNNSCPIVGYMDIDLSTDINHLNDVIKIFKSKPEICMVNGSRLNKESSSIGRKWYRNLTSKGLSFLLKMILGMEATDSICGFKFWKKECIEQLIKEAGESEDGWFYIIELLLRAERKKANIYELPVHWKDDYNSTVNVLNLIKNYCWHIIRLRKLFNETVPKA